MSGNVIGIDSGSTYCKAVLLQGSNVTLRYVSKTGYLVEDSARGAAEAIMKRAGIASEDAAIVATGYGRESISFAHKHLTEITCHARGAHYLAPDAAGVLDIGGQDLKAIRLNGARVADFLMNDKCAAGTGRFFDMACRTLGLEFSEIDANVDLLDIAPINSMCTVFAESEIVSLIAKKTDRRRILGGVVISVASKVSLLCAKLGFKPGDELLMTGGLANCSSLTEALSMACNCSVYGHADSIYAGAIGAALSA